MTEEEIRMWCRDKGQDLEDNNTYDIELHKTRPIDFSTAVVARLDLNALILLASSPPPYVFKRLIQFPFNILHTCSICWDKRDFKQTFVELRCGHTFHKDCLETWFETSPSCCLCRKDCLDLDRIPIDVGYEDDEIDFDINLPEISYSDMIGGLFQFMRRSYFW